MDRWTVSELRTWMRNFILFAEVKLRNSFLWEVALRHGVISALLPGCEMG